MNLNLDALNGGGGGGGGESGDVGGASTMGADVAAGSGGAPTGTPMFTQPVAMNWLVPTVRYPPGVKPDSVPGPRAAHSCNLVSNKQGQQRLLVFGGWNGRCGLADFAQLDLATMEWSSPPTTGTPPSTRNNHSTFVAGTKLFVHGGHDGHNWLADLWTLDTEKLEWSQPLVAGTPPSPRACHTTSLVGRRVVRRSGRRVWRVWGGAVCCSGNEEGGVVFMVPIRPLFFGVLVVAADRGMLILLAKRRNSEFARETEEAGQRRVTNIHRDCNNCTPSRLLPVHVRRLRRHPVLQ